jgi:mannosyl-oligosaccharide alpha-1,2-mannosidase
MLTRRFTPIYFICGIFAFVLFTFYPSAERTPVSIPLKQPVSAKPPPGAADHGSFNWTSRKEDYPVSSMIPMPSGKPVQIPTIQFQFGKESKARTAEIASRRDAVKASFDRAWEGYKSKAWMKDELAPISGTARNPFAGWAATLVDTLDTLLIMDKTADFELAVGALKDIDFTTTEDEELNTFETTIRYLGGLLSANDLSNGTYPILVEKALQLGHLLYAAFDTPNRMPIGRWQWKKCVLRLVDSQI